MSKYQKLILKILRGASDADIGFDDLRRLLDRLGFTERISGSHHLFRKAGIVEKINLQTDGGKAKPYQVRQVRAVLIKYRLVEDA
jgi:virulence-associated protein VapD